MNEVNTEKHENSVQGAVKELEFQVSTVLNRLEEAVEKFDSKGTINSLEFNQSLSLTPKSPEEIVNIIQDAIVNLNLSREDEDPNLAILPALRDVDKLALLSHSIKHYVLCLDVAHSDYLISWIENETSRWLMQLFGFEDGHVLYDETYVEGCLKLVRFLLLKKYPTYNQDGFEAFKESTPVIYYNTPAMFITAQYICCCSGLPMRFIQEVPSFATGEKNDDKEILFRRILEENKSKNKIPLLLLAGVETQIQPLRCNISQLRSICNEYNVWLHLTGNSIAVLPILQQKREVPVNLFDSISVTLGPWLNIPAVPVATIYRVAVDDKMVMNNVDIENKRPMALPLWTSIQCLGKEQIFLNDVIQKFESCQRLYQRLEKISCLKMISQPVGDDLKSCSITDLLSKPNIQNHIFELVISSVVFKFLPENHELWPSTYCDKLNSWLCQVLHRELPVVPITLIELEKCGTVLRYSPFSNTPLISESDWSSFYACLDQQLDILKSTVAQKETLYKLIQNSKCLKLVELPDWAGLGGVRYVPEAWNLEDPSIMNELNRLNIQIVQQLRNTDSAFSIGESVDGYSSIRFGMVGWDSDVLDLINLVESVGKQEEESWNYIDTMAEVVKKGIETAMLDLQKESEEKLWQEGILRHVPVFGNIVNWWSPLNKENGAGIKGRSLDLTAGVIESTENIYRYHMQGASKILGAEQYSESGIPPQLTPTGSRRSETENNVQPP